MSATIRLFSEDDEARMRAALHGIGEGVRRAFRGLGARVEQARRDRDDELDWLGEWHGKVTR